MYRRLSRKIVTGWAFRIVSPFGIQECGPHVGSYHIVWMIVTDCVSNPEETVRGIETKKSERNLRRIKPIEVDWAQIGKDMGNPWVSNSQPVPIPTSNPYPRPVGTCFHGLTHGFQVICTVAMQIIYICTTRQ